jgi:hypothetical protein
MTDLNDSMTFALRTLLEAGSSGDYLAYATVESTQVYYYPNLGGVSEVALDWSAARALKRRGLIEWDGDVYLTDAGREVAAALPSEQSEDRA